MTDLLERYVKEMETLPVEQQKRFKKEFINKANNDVYGYRVPKNMAKLQVVADDNVIVDFMVNQMKIYDRRPEIQNLDREYTEHVDIVRYRASFVIFALSNNAQALDYLTSKIDTYITQKQPLFLYFLYDLLGDFPEKFASILEKIKQHYEQIIPELASYKWAERLNLPLPEISPKGWRVRIVITTNGSLFPHFNATEEEKSRHFIFEVNIFSPSQNNRAWDVDFHNRTHEVSGWFQEGREGRLSSRSQAFSVEDLFSGNPDYLQMDIFKLNEFITEVEKMWDIQFVLKPSSISVSKGLDKKKILQWVENKFAF